MADKNEIKELLKRKLDASASKYIPPQRLDEAATEIIKAGSATKELLEEIGRSKVGDSTTFANTDIDDINDVLNQLDE